MQNILSGITEVWDREIDGAIVFSKLLHALKMHFKKI